MKSVKPHILSIADSLEILLSRLPEDKEKFLNDGVLQDATLMKLQEAGEQMVRIRDNFPEYYSEHQTDAWHKLIGMRNIIAHGYLEIDMEEVWKTVSENIKPLLDSFRTLA